MAGNRGFAKMPREKVREIARKGGEASPTKFKVGDPRAREAGRKGGLARSQDSDFTKEQEIEEYDY